jgi:carbamoyltransferase
MKIIGFNYDMLISSMCFLDNEIIKFATPEERFSREKNTRKFPAHAINFLKKKYNLNFSKIDYFASSINPGVYFNKFNPLISNNRKHFAEHLISFPDHTLNNIKNRDRLESEHVKQDFIFKDLKKTFFYINHHDAHAANAFYSSGFKKSLTFVIDLQGEISSISIYVCKKGKFEKIHEIQYPNSIGMLYATITEFLGFRANSDEWKVMALSNYKKVSEKYYKIFRKKIINYDDSGNYNINLHLFNGYYPSKPNLYNKNLISILGKPLQSKSIPDLKTLEISYALQRVTEEIINSMIRYYSKKFKLNNICLSGGVFMNCLMNGRISIKNPNLNFYIPFAPDDSGNSIGAAAYLKYNILKNNKLIRNLKDPYLGISFSDEEIVKELKRYKLNYIKSKKVEKLCAEYLFKNQIIGWFQDKAEFGQRALGNRSILANPLNPKMKDTLNSVIKYRENFRPFAPSIIEEHAIKYFDIDKKEKIYYMEKIFNLKKKYRNKLNSICNKDGSSRLHLVNKDNNNKFYNLLLEFEKLSKYPILINTSFNIKDEPIVNTVTDAIRTFFSCGLDKLIINNYIISK